MAHYENIICDSNIGIFLVCDLLVYFPNYLRMIQVRGSLPCLGSTGSRGLVLIGIQFRDPGHTHGELILVVFLRMQ